MNTKTFVARIGSPATRTLTLTLSQGITIGDGQCRIDWTLVATGTNETYPLNKTFVKFNDILVCEYPKSNTSGFPRTTGSASGYFIVTLPNTPTYANVSFQSGRYSDANLTEYGGQWKLNGASSIIESATDIDSLSPSASLVLTDDAWVQVTALDISLSLDGTNPLWSWQSITSGAKNVSVTIVDVEDLYDGVPTTSKHTSVYYLLKATTSDGTIYIFTQKTFTINNADTSVIPDVSLSLTPINTDLPVAYQSEWIRTKTKASGVVTASAKRGATIASRQVVIGNQTFTTSTFTGTVPIDSYPDDQNKLLVTTTVRDSRGFSKTITQEITLANYSAPNLFNTSIVRCDSGGTPEEDGVYAYLSTTFSVVGLLTTNETTLKFRYANSNGGSFSAWSTLDSVQSTGLSVISTKTYGALLTGTYANTDSWIFEVSATDSLGEEALITIYVDSVIPVVHLAEGGNAIGIGKYANTNKPNTIQSAWKLILDSGLEGEHLLKELTNVDLDDIGDEVGDGFTPIFVGTGVSDKPNSSYSNSFGWVLKDGTYILVILINHDISENQMAIRQYRTSWSNWFLIDGVEQV